MTLFFCVIWAIYPVKYRWKTAVSTGDISSYCKASVFQKTLCQSSSRYPIVPGIYTQIPGTETKLLFKKYRVT